jgi:hypothetical protein
MQVGEQHSNRDNLDELIELLVAPADRVGRQRLASGLRDQASAETATISISGSAAKSSGLRV